MSSTDWVGSSRTALAPATDGLHTAWFLAHNGLRTSPTRSLFVTLSLRVLTPMISTRPLRVQAPRADPDTPRGTSEGSGAGATGGDRRARREGTAGTGSQGGGEGAREHVWGPHPVPGMWTPHV
ncbi:hypothetical protein FF041_30565 [Streptomyces jumonjinensis]|uniref:Uncharacterized protein n=1 Tax=Streptomyces jumonjinensis TaxID=1945 RepID=A0A646KR52_STRJU|nr:hypothetical protein [Streptomyces jumonjinensis]